MIAYVGYRIGAEVIYYTTLLDYIEKDKAFTYNGQNLYSEMFSASH